MKPSPGKGGFEHKLWQDLVSKQRKKDGFEPVIEGRVRKGSSKAIDVLVYSETEGYIGYELTIHFENLVSNIIQDFEAGVSQVVVVTRDETELKKAQEIVTADSTLSSQLDKVVFSTISEFFD